MRQKNTPSSMARKEGVHAIESLGSKPETRSVSPQPIASEPAAEFIPDAVTENRRNRDQSDEQANVKNFLSGKEPAEHNHAFARHEKTEESLTFQKDNDEDDEVTPLLETED